ncbi:MAG: DUF3793 family protein, partial [Treponema sp.]|nr:DUF3793 family protein [Treponema sp.]
MRTTLWTVIWNACGTALRNTKTRCSHEIGLFLEYPSYDLEDFCAHHGKNHLLCGYCKMGVPQYRGHAGDV